MPDLQHTSNERAVFVSWVAHHGRSDDLAHLLDADALWFARGTARNPWSAPIRHVLQSIDTIRALRRRRPSVAYVMAPPTLAVVSVRAAVGRNTRLVLDAHGKAVRRIGSDRVRMSFRVLSRFVDAVLVTNGREAARIKPHHSSVHVIQDPIGPSRVSLGPRPIRPVVVFPASWEVDEPIDEVVEAARLASEFDWVITGNPRRTLVDRPANLLLPGRLPDAAYFDLLARSAAVLALTTRSDTMQRAGYDAAVVGAPLVASDTAALREFFGPAARYAGNDPTDLAAAVRGAIRSEDALRAAMVDLARRCREEQSSQLAVLLAAHRAK